MSPTECSSFASSEPNIAGTLRSPFTFSDSSSSNLRQFEGRTFSGRVYCSPKALWRLTWFLRDFGYDSELLGHDEVDDKNLVGLRGVVKISHAVLNGTTLLNLDAFAPASQWEELSVASSAAANDPEAA